jgi:uncharacterized delta-60 repeat protein
VGGSTSATGVGANDFAVLRLTSVGTVDMTFDGDGKQTVDFGFDDQATGIAIQPDGRIVLGGFIDGGAANFAVARMDAGGTLDPSFDGDGRADTTFGNADFARALALQDDGAIVLAGTTDAGGTEDFAVARFLSDGTLDAAFSGDGRFTLDLGGQDRANALAIQPDGAYVLAGTTTPGDFAVARVR